MKNKQVTPASAPKKRGRPRKTLTPVNKKPTPTQVLELVKMDVAELTKLTIYWRDAYHQMDARYRDSQAVIKYLENKIAQLLA